jgi:IS30 family transposase
LFGVVHHFLVVHWSPEQIALTLVRIYPKGHKSRVSHETIYNCIYAQPVGELRRELVACLRQAHNKRTPRSKGQDRRGQIPDMLSIHVRPPEIEDRQFPGHWEGDLGFKFSRMHLAFLSFGHVRLVPLMEHSLNHAQKLCSKPDPLYCADQSMAVYRSVAITGVSA